MVRCCTAIAAGAVIGAAVALIGGYLILVYGPDISAPF